MFQLARSYLLTNIHNNSARNLSLKQPYAQEFTEHKALTYNEAELEQRFNTQSYLQEFGEQDVSPKALNQILAHLDLQLVIAQDSSLDDDDFVLIVQEGTLLASNWQEQIADSLQAAANNHILKERLNAISLGDSKELTFNYFSRATLETRRKIVAGEHNYLNLRGCDFTKKRLELLPQFTKYLEDKSPLTQNLAYKSRVFNNQGKQLTATNEHPFSQTPFTSLTNINEPLELVCVSQLPLHEPVAYLMRVKAIREYINKLCLDPQAQKQQLQVLKEAQAKFQGLAQTQDLLTKVASVWHQPLAWNMSMWHQLFEFNVGSIAITNPSIAVSNFRYGNFVLTLDSLSLVSWMQTHQIQAGKASLGYDYVTSMPKFVMFKADHAYSLQQFYNNSQTTNFMPLMLDSPSASSQHSLSLGWSRIFSDLSNNSHIYNSESLSQTLALYRVFQAVLANPQIGEQDYFIVANSFVSLDPDWQTRLNQSLAYLAGGAPNNLILLGDTVGAKNLDYQAPNLYEQGGQAFASNVHFYVQPDFANLYNQNEYFAQSLQSLIKLSNKNFSFLILNKGLIKSYVQRLREELGELTSERLEKTWFSAQENLQTGLSDYDPENIEQLIAPLKEDPLYKLLFLEDNLSHREIKENNPELLKDILFHEQLKNFSQEGSTESEHLQEFWLESLLKTLAKVRAKTQDKLFSNKEQLKALIDLEQLNDWQILTLAAPLFEINYSRLSWYLDFTSHSIIQVNPPLAQALDTDPTAKIINEEQFGFSEYQNLRSNRQKQRLLTYLDNNQEQYPDYLSKVRKFVISLPQSKDRLQAFKAQTHAQDFELFPAVYGKELSEQEISSRFDSKRFYNTYERIMTLGEIGCTLSHWEIYQKVLQDPSIADDDWVLVCEDDTKFFTNWYERTNSILHYLYNNPERNTQFIQCSNNMLNQDRALPYHKLKEITYFRFEADDLICLNPKQSIFFPTAVVSYGSAHYLFKKSLLKTNFFQNLNRPYWVADDFPRFFEYLPDTYVYASPMLSHQDNDNFTSIIEEERTVTREAMRKRLLETELYKPLNFLNNKVIIIQRSLTEEQIQEKFADISHIIKRQEFDKLSDQELEKYYDLEAFQANYQRLPTREEMIRAIMHQEAYRYLNNLIDNVHNYYLILEDDVQPVSKSSLIFANQVVNYIATRLDTRTEVIELSNLYWNQALEKHQQDPRELPGHIDLEAQLASQGRSVATLEYADLTPNEYGYLFSDYPIEQENFADYYILGNAKQNYHINSYLDIQITENHACTGGKAYLIFTYPLKTQDTANKPIAWLHDDFPKFVFYHNLALAYAMPPLYF
ncbi:glycosyltransferase family 25 protein [Psittacicella gerlachiana]|uniref:Glycosyl transferase family 25 domain-containing protein n=1 Tax=Psittacicella gerlachiana TaxID=2028574 RepID=A0A3A1YK74_9GAMM|nr:glycosyltransferase family 25 protein [Psittacicella gerlachiana]RIY36437.1 hypothetical protein CKF59_02725 [Psittacicella gerlachiana]